MTVEVGKQVSIEYTLTIGGGDVVDTNVGSDPFIYVQGASQIVPGLETALEGMEIGDTKEVILSPQEGFGERSEKAFKEVDKNLVPEEARKVGTRLQGRDDRGGIVNARVADVKDETVVLDLNHPLAGETLHFNVKILDIQDPSA